MTAPAQPKRDPVRTASNRVVLKIAGRWPRAYSVVHHVGRTSGRRYRNPVSAYPLGDGFVIAAPYGAESNWVRNVLAADEFTLRTKSRDHLLDRPEIITPDRALPAHAPLSRRMMRPRRPALRVGAPGGSALSRTCFASAASANASICLADRAAVGASRNPGNPPTGRPIRCRHR